MPKNSTGKTLKFSQRKWSSDQNFGNYSLPTGLIWKNYPWLIQDGEVGRVYEVLPEA